MLRTIQALAFIAVLSPLAVYAADTCRPVFAKAVNQRALTIVKMDRALARNYKVGILKAADELGGVFGGSFDRREKAIRLNQRSSVTDQYLVRFHESVHVATHNRVEAKPNDAQNALAIMFARESGEISSKIQEEYREFFGFDEMKAYFKEAELLEQLARTDKTLDKADSMKTAKQLRVIAHGFATEGEKILLDAKSVLVKHMAGLTQSIQAVGYSRANSQIAIVMISIPQPSGAPIDIGVPVTLKGNWRTEVVDYERPVMKLIDSGIALARSYRARLEERIPE